MVAEPAAPAPKVTKTPMVMTVTMPASAEASVSILVAIVVIAKSVMTSIVAPVAVSFPKVPSLVRVPSALHTTFVDVVVDLVGLITNDDDGHLAKVAALVDLREHARYVVKGVRRKEIEDQDIGVGIA